MTKISKKINEARIIKGLTQEELAELSSVNLRTIQRLENNETVPRGKTLNLICDALQINAEDLRIQDKTSFDKYLTIATNIFFLGVLNFALMGVFGYLLLDSEATMNSRFAGFLLSFFIPIFIVYKTEHMNPLERLLKFGSGFMLYIILVLFWAGFATGFLTGLFPCLIISLAILYYGSYVTNK
ncbi:helix-turn-helix transcriptional regulator [Psychroserpens sp. AS72]|uniref:helix-turn-helix domain-containing protein n=1 Tax=Psychroserpens sp. AS72 TaxID=3135775 RepID=UPI00316B6F9D